MTKAILRSKNDPKSTENPCKAVTCFWLYGFRQYHPAAETERPEFRGVKARHEVTDELVLVDRVMVNDGMCTDFKIEMDD